MWLIFLALYFVFGTASYLIRRTLAHKFDQYNALLNATYFVFFIIPTAIIWGLMVPHNFDIGAANFIYLIVGGLIWPLFAVLAFRANKDVDVGIFVVILNTSPIFTLLIAIPFLNESLSSQQYIGVTFLIAAGVLAGLSQLRSSAKLSKTGIIYSILTAAALGTGIAFERFMLNRIDFGTYLIVGWGMTGVWMAIFAYRQWPKLGGMLRQIGSKSVVAYGLLNTLKSIFFILGILISGSAALFSPAASFLAVVVVITAYFVLRERQHMPQKITSAGIGILGLILLSS